MNGKRITAQTTPSVAFVCMVLLAMTPETTFAACDTFAPASGEQTTCSADAVPVTQPIIAETNSTQVTVRVDPGATLDVTGNNGVLIYDSSVTDNQGAVSLSGDTFDAFSSRGDNNQQTNSGSITTSGIQSEGLFSEGNNNQLTNSATGTITTTGDNSSGMANISNNAASNNALINNGTIATSGNGGDGMYVQSGGNTLTNNGTITTSGSVAHGMDSNGSGNTLVNNAAINTSGVGSNGINNVGSGSPGQATNNGAISTTATNANGVYFSNVGTFTNSSTGTINASGAYGVYLSAGGTINNAGIINAGRSAITNDVGPTVVNNSGNLSSGSGDFGIWFFNSPGDVLNNSGNITGGNGIAVQFTAGDDQFIWHDSGIISGSVLLDAGADTAILRNLAEAQTNTLSLLDGGEGNDSLQLDNTFARNPGRFTNFEILSLTNGSALTLDSPLILGDSTTATGTLTIDASSQLLAGEQSAAQINPAIVGSLVTVTNAGVINLASGGSSATDNLTINGNYVGQNGTIRLQTVLGNDSSASDKVTISGGQASGSTQLQIINLGGTGAATLASGILLVDTVNGGTTTTSAFNLAGGAVSAGAYEYRLFRGGLNAGSTDNWYLRNALIVTPPVDPGNPGSPGTPGTPGTPPVTPNPPTGPTEPGAPPVKPPVTPPVVVPLYRNEVPLYAALPPLAFNLGLAQIGTFHDRQGEQRFLTDGNSGSWGRILASHTEQHWAGDVSPSFDGNISGMQLGQDLYASDNQRAGLYFGYTRLDGDVRGFTQGRDNNKAGTTVLNGYSLGAYWTHVWQNQAYLDAVLMNTWLNGTQESSRNRHADIGGTLRSASLEAGYPIPLNAIWALELQAQAIVQNLSLDDSHDQVSSIRYDNVTSSTGRVGLRLQGNYSGIMPWIKLNYWQGANQTVELRLDDDAIHTDIGSKAIQIGTGVSAQLTQNTNIYVAANQTSDLDGEHRRDYSGNIGVRIEW